MRLIMRGSMKRAASNVLHSPPKRTSNGVGSKRVMGPVPLSPASSRLRELRKAIDALDHAWIDEAGGIKRAAFPAEAHLERRRIKARDGPGTAFACKQPPARIAQSDRCA